MYKLLLFSPDGDFVTDSPRKTVDECAECSANMGSRWIFYPFHFIIKDKGNVKDRQCIIEPPEELDFLKNKNVKYVKKFIEEYGLEICHGV